MAIRAVGFDFDHTLGIDNKLERVAFLHLLSAICEGGGRWMGSLAEESANIDRLLAEQRSGAFTIDAAVVRFANERGARDPGSFVQRYKDLALGSVEAFVVPDPTAAELLGGLRDRGIPVAILTNGWAPLQQRKAERVGFDGPVLVSEQLGVQKPHPAAFAQLARTLGVPPPEIAFVGDTPASDVQGAIAGGMLGVWLDAEGVSYPDAGPRPSLTIAALNDLLKFL